MQILVHRYGTYSRASALEDKNTIIKATQTHPRIVEVLSRGLLTNIKQETNTHSKLRSSRDVVYGHFRPEYGANTY